MWQEQLISIVEENSLDLDHIADLLIAYEAETGDASLRGCGEVLMFVGALRPWPAVSGSGSWSGSKSRSGPVSGSKISLTGYWSRSRSGSGSKSKSGSGLRSRSYSGSRSMSRSLSRSKSR